MPVEDESDTEEDRVLFRTAQARAEAARARRLLEEAQSGPKVAQPPDEVIAERFPLGQPTQPSQALAPGMSQLSQEQLSQLALPYPNMRAHTHVAPTPTQATVLASQISTESAAFAELQAHLAGLPSQTQASQSARVAAMPATAMPAAAEPQAAQMPPVPPHTMATRAAAPIRGTAGRSSGSRNYTEEERLNFLQIMERNLPISGTEWALLAREHAQTYPGNNRDVPSIKRQYQALLRRREPTGDPHCPPDVKKAKYIDRLLKAKQSAGDISEESGGPLAAVAGLEAVGANSERLSDTDSTRPPPLQAGSVLVQKRTQSPRTTSSHSLIESMLAMQVMAQQSAAAERAEARKREREEREEQRKERERERKEQRRMENRREEMFMGLLGIGLAMAGGRSGTEMDPVRLASTLRRARSDSDDSKEDTENQNKS